jgi:hypothetical protein
VRGTAAIPTVDAGAGAGLGGLNSHLATTTARVAEVPLTLAEYGLAIQSSLQQQGWDPCDGCAMSEALDLAATVVGWPVGSVVERRLDELVVRSLGVDA